MPRYDAATVTTRKLATTSQPLRPGDLGFETALSADELRGNLDSAEYKHVVLGLIFFKYISDVFEEKHAGPDHRLSDPSRDLFIKDVSQRYSLPEPVMTSAKLYESPTHSKAPHSQSENFTVASDHCRFRELPRGPRARRATHASHEIWASTEQLNCLSQRGWIVGRNQQAGLPMCDRIGRSARVAADAWDAVQCRLDVHEPKSFQVRGESKHVARSVQVFRILNLTEERHAGAQTFRRETLQRASLLPASCDKQSPLGTSFGQSRGSLDQIIDAFAGNQARKRTDDEGVLGHTQTSARFRTAR